MPTPKPQKLTKETIEGLNILVYGNQGIGKTMFAATAADVPEMREVLILNIEGGLMTVAERNDLLMVDIKKVRDIEDIFWAVVKKEDGYENVNTVVIDSATALQDISMKEIRTRRGRKEGETMINDWGESTQTLRDIFRSWRDLGINTVITALVKKDYAGDVYNPGPVTTVRPALTTSLCDSVMGLQDFVLYMYKEEETAKDESGNKVKVVKRKMLTTDQGIIRAKMRSPRLADVIGTVWENPDIPTLYDAWKNAEPVKKAS